MRKNFRTLLGMILVVVLLGACTAGEETDIESDCKTDSWENRPKTEAIIAGKIAEIYEDAFLLAGTDSAELYMVSRNLKVYGLDDELADGEALKPGQRVEIGYSGLVLESYPAQLGSPLYVKITNQGEDLIGFYQTVLADLWAVDPGLNPETGVLAFDLTNVENLNDGEKSALIYVMGQAYKMQSIAGTFGSLSEEGYIDAENLIFKDGILFSFELSDVEEDSFTFSVTKWRSGLGAYTFYDCKAIKEGDWTYTVGGHMIS